MTHPRAQLFVGDAKTCPDLQYVTGFRATDPVVALRHGRRTTLVVPGLELGRASREASRCRVLTPNELKVGKGKQRSIAQWALGLMKEAGLTRADVPDFFPHHVAAELERAGVRLRSVPRLVAERAVKSEHEIACLREAQGAACHAMREAIAMIASADITRSGELKHGRKVLSSEAMHRHIRHVLLDRDCVAPMVIVAGGAQAADPHEEGHGPLHAGQTVVIDIFPQSTRHGYWGDITRTVVRGEASPAIRKLYRTVARAQRDALAALRPGVKCSTIHQRVVDVFDAAEYKTGRDGETMFGFFHGTGHGVGLEIHEAPNLAPVDGRLKAGHVVTVEPGLYYPELGGVRIEDTVEITKTGYRFLGRCKKALCV